MGSRIRDNPDNIFECFLEIVGPTETSKDPWILQKYPDTYNKEDILKAVSQFAYPCDIESNTVQHFSFVLTSIDSKWTFGYCRHAPASSTCLCILSYLPWHETFFKLLDRIAEVTRNGEADELDGFLGSVYGSLVPLPGAPLRVSYDGGGKLFECPSTDHRKLPSFPENRNLNEYYNAVDVNNMILIFASMLNERRVIITSSKLGRLSACVQAASALIYPMHWQHIFIPVLPIHLLDYLSAPMPFLIGVPASVFQRAKRTEMGDVVVLYADTNTCESPFDDVQSLPLEITSGLKRKLRNMELLRGDGIARAFLQALVQLIGGYRDALTFKDGERISFCRDTFLQTRPNNMQPYMERLLQLQIFQQFIEERLDLLNSGKGFGDVFEEVSLEMDKSGAKFKNQYKDWMGNMKKEGGALLRNMKSKANPAVKHAYKHMKDRSRKAYKEVRSMFKEPMMQDVTYPSARSGVMKARPRSAPSSPTSLVRSTSLNGTKLSRSSGHQRSVVSYVRPRDGITRRTVSGRIDIPLMKKPNQYDPLGGSKQAPSLAPPPLIEREESSNSLDDSSSSPDLSVQRINMDLMGDLQDLIFRRCSLDTDDVKNMKELDQTLPIPSPSNACLDTILKPPPIRSISNALIGTSAPVLFSPPIPPPRSRRGPGQIPGPGQGGLTVDLIKDSSKRPNAEISLIRLDSEETEEVVFDPLLAKDNLPVRMSSSVFQSTANYQGVPLIQASSVSVQNTNTIHASPLSPGLNNPVYFHVNPIRLGNTSTSNTPTPTVMPTSSTFPVYQRKAYTEPFSELVTGHLVGNTQTETNQPMGVLNGNSTDRLSTLKPQESFLHSMRTSTSPSSSMTVNTSVSERTKLFENLKMLNRSSNVDIDNANADERHQAPTLDQRKQWQTFD